jgi:hypothetical protein
MVVVPSLSRVLDSLNLKDEGTMVLHNAGIHWLSNAISHPEDLNCHQGICYDLTDKVCKTGFSFALT